jgi:hypothetical protein
MMNRLASACLVLLAGASCAAQEGLAIRIETSQEGLHRIAGEAIRAYVQLDRIVPERLALTHDGDPVPIEIFGASDGHLDPSDEILFFAERPRQRHARTETYVLTDRGKPARWRAGATSSGAGEPATEAQIVALTARSAVFDQIATVRQDVIRGPAISPWFSAALAPKGARPRDRAAAQDVDPTAVSFQTILEPRPLKELPARIRVNVFGAVANGISQKLAINVNGTELTTQTFESPLAQKLVVTIPQDVLRRENVVRFTNLSDVQTYSEPDNEISSRRRNDLLIESFSILYDAQLVGPSVSGQQVVFHLAPGEGTKPRQVRIEQRQREGYIVFEPKAGRVWRGSVVEIPSDREVTLAVCSLGGAYQPESIQPLRATREHITGAGGDYVIVTTTDLRPAVTMLADHRRAEGFTPVIVEARELYDAFTNGAFHPSAIQKFLVAATLNWPKKPRYLLLVGDADLDVNFVNQREPLPAWLVMTDYNGMTATDALHADLDSDGLADIPVGRIPTRSREDFLAVARRIIALETNPPSGAWRRKITFVAGEGRFGPVIDQLLEGQAKAVISAIPPEYDVEMTYGNPGSEWYWPAEDFNGHLIRTFNDGSLVFTYIGHGSPEAFDHVNVGSTVYPILSLKDVDSLSNQGRSPVMAIIACSTGRYDDPRRDCLAEKMFLKDGGPIAVIAASRISHPYPNALLGKGIAQPFFDAKNRVGDAFLAGTRSMIKGANEMLLAMAAKQFLSKAVRDKTLVRDHAHIYNLIGDPAQKVPFPAPIEKIGAPETAKAGSTVEIEVPLAAGQAEAWVSIEARRGARKSAAESGPVNAGAGERPAAPEAVQARHAAANDHAIARGRFTPSEGVLKASLPIPAGTPPGSYAVVVFVPGSPGVPDAAGAKKIVVEE